jgi:hypothetical protein
MAFSFKPTKESLSDGVIYGVNDTMAGYIVQNEDKTDNVENLEIRDQWGRMMYVIAYDKSSTISLTMIGKDEAPFDIGDAIEISSNTITKKATPGEGDFIVQSVRRTCVYNDTAKWQIDATAWSHATPVDKTDDNASPIAP